MTITVRALFGAKDLEGAQATQYTAVGVRAIIDKATVTNVTTGNVVLSVNIVSNGGTVADSNQIIRAKTIMPNETYTCPELVGHVLDPGSYISTVASAGASLTMRVSGREVA